MSQEREKLSAVVQVVQSYLNTYLQNYSYKLMTKEDLVPYQKRERDFQIYQSTTNNKDLILLITSGCGERNSYLCWGRVDNFLNTNEKLNVFLREKLDKNDINLREDFKEIQKILDAALVINNGLSATHAVVHRTYKQNALAGNGFFSSWWNKTFFQSRATIALEMALEKLEESRENLGLNSNMVTN